MGKKDKGSVKKSSDGEDLKREQKLQAVVLADSFMKTFRPISWEKPKVLMPLVNTPMLDYTIDFLAQNNVKEVFVFCVWQSEMLQEYISNKRWPTSITVTCLTSSKCLSAGDALREIDSMGIVRSDPFILINGDVVSNMKLAGAIAFHKEKKRLDNNAVMTVALKAVQHCAGPVPILEDLVVAFDKNSKQILLFDNDVTKRGVSIPLEIMAEHPSVVLRTDLLDCHIDICSPELLLQFSDNFDYQNIRKHFIKNEVVNWELGMHIYGYLLNNEYAARVQDARTYHAVSRDIITRWVYPVVPDLPKLQDVCSTAVHIGRCVYREDNVRIARSARIGNGVVLGRGTVVHENAFVSRSVLGHNCVIGPGAVVEDSHLWEGVIVGENSKICCSILCDKVSVKTNSTVNRGCVLSFGVTIGTGVVLPPYTRLSKISKTSKNKKAECADEDMQYMASSPMCSVLDGNNPLFGTPKDFTGGPSPYELTGTDGYGFLWKSKGGEEYMDVVDSLSDDDDGLLQVTNEYNGSEVISWLKATSIGCKEEETWKRSLWSAMPAPEEDSESEDEDYGGLDDEDSLLGAKDDKPIGSGVTLALKNTESSNFEMSVFDMVMSGNIGGHSVSNVLLEIKGLKFAENKEFVDCIRGVVPAILDIAVRTAVDSSGTASPPMASLVGAIKGQFEKDSTWGYTLLSALIQGSEDEMAVLEAIEDKVLEHDSKNLLYSIFRLIIQICYDSDLISHSTFERWIAVRKLAAPPETSPSNISTNWAERIVLFEKPQVQQFVDWLLQDESSEDDDEDDDDS